MMLRHLGLLSFPFLLLPVSYSKIGAFFLFRLGRILSPHPAPRVMLYQQAAYFLSPPASFSSRSVGCVLLCTVSHPDSKDHFILAAG